MPRQTFTLAFKLQMVQPYESYRWVINQQATRSLLKIIEQMMLELDKLRKENQQLLMENDVFIYRHRGN